MPILSEQELREFTLDVLTRLGTPPDAAEVVCNTLVGANLVGHDSHGVLRLTTYAQWVREGLIRPTVEPQVVRRQGATAHVDGGWGWGPVGARLAAATAIDLARSYGVGAVTLDHCAHIGRMGEYVEMMAAAGMTGMAVCNHYPSVAPFGGRERMLGTNPFAFGAPGGAEAGAPAGPPVIVDFATAGVAEGKLRVARAKGERVGPGLIVDCDGQPSQEPDAFYAGGALLPFGGHKGYGIGLMVEILGGILSGAAPGVLPIFAGANGSLFLALNVGAFVAPEVYAAQMGELARTIGGSQPAAGGERVLLPGEPERLTAQRRKVEGIPIPEATWDELRALRQSITEAV